MSTNENENEVTAAEEAAVVDSIMGNIERDALVAQAREFLEVDVSRVEKNSFQPTMFFREAGYPGPRVVFFPELDGDPQCRNKIAWAALLLSATIDDLHSITWVTDSYGAMQATKTDGSQWGYGDMQKAVEEQTEDAKLIFEQLNYQTMELMADGSLRSSMICFNYTRNDDGTVNINFDDPKVFIEGLDEGRAQGFYIDAMTAAFGAPKLREEINKIFPAGGALGLSEKQQQVHALCAAIKMVMQEIQMPVLIPCRDQEEQEILEHSFNEGPTFGPRNFSMFNQDQVELIGRLEEQFDLDSSMYSDALKTKEA